MRVHRWTWQDYALAALTRCAFAGALFLLSLIVWRAFAVWQ